MAKKACIETFGCQMNVHDSERMAGLIEQAGYELTDDVGDADLVLINTCSVREKAVDKLFGRLGEFGAGGRERPLVAVTGCVAQQEGGRLLKRSANVDVVVTLTGGGGSVILSGATLDLPLGATVTINTMVDIFLEDGIA